MIIARNVIMIGYNYNDGGRKRSGIATNNDCVIRAIAIATNIPYHKVYNDIYMLSLKERPSKVYQSTNLITTGVRPTTTKKYLASLGWKWTATMGIGTGCKIHLKKDELPKGVIIARVSKHIVTVIDGVMQDVTDCSRNGTRCVYGYWTKEYYAL
jgi:hypothetical protein